MKPIMVSWKRETVTLWTLWIAIIVLVLLNVDC